MRGAPLQTRTSQRTRLPDNVQTTGLPPKQAVSSTPLVVRLTPLLADLVAPPSRRDPQEDFHRSSTLGHVDNFERLLQMHSAETGHRLKQPTRPSFPALFQ